MLKQSPRWIASCQSALWDTFVWAPFLLPLLPSAPLVASSFGLCADGWGRQTGSRRGFGRAAPLSGPEESIPQPWPRDPGCTAARPGLAALTSQPRETNTQLVQMAVWFNIDRKSMEESGVFMDLFLSYSPVKFKPLCLPVCLPVCLCPISFYPLFLSHLLLIETYLMAALH